MGSTTTGRASERARDADKKKGFEMRAGLVRLPNCLDAPGGEQPTAAALDELMKCFAPINAVNKTKQSEAKQQQNKV